MASGIVLDTNLLSLLAATDKLDLIQRLAKQPLYVTAAIEQELQVGVDKNVPKLQAVLALIQAGQIQVLVPSESEQALMAAFPNKLALGEAEGIAICQQRNMIFITRDRKAANYCDRMGITCIRLRALLEQFQQAGLLTLLEVETILS